MIFLVLRKTDLLVEAGLSPNTFMLLLGNALSMSISLELALKILGLPPFSGLFNVMVLLVKSMSVHSSLLVSPERMAVSFMV